MKKYFTLLVLALVTLVSCDKDETGGTPKKEYDVYIAGNVEDDVDASAYPVCWKNSGLVCLSGGGSARSISLVGNDVYVMGADKGVEGGTIADKSYAT